MPQQFSAAASAVLAQATSEAHALGATTIGTPHLLLALMDERDRANARLVARGGSGAQVQPRTNGAVAPKAERVLRYRSDTKRALRQARSLAAQFGSAAPGTSHLLAALLAEEDHPVQRILGELGLDPDQLFDLAYEAVCQGEADRPILRSAPRSRRAWTAPGWSQGLADNALLLGALVCAVLSAGSVGIAALVDMQAFLAIATPTLYAWLALSVLSAVGIAIDRVLASGGQTSPTYFRIILVVGAATGLIALPHTLRVITKSRASPTAEQVNHPLDLKGETLANTSMIHRNLRGADLAGATLRNVDLGNSDLAEANLQDTRFVGVNLSGVNLCGADLRGADLRGALHLSSVADWAYAFYNHATRLPKGQSFLTIPGPIPDTHSGLLYMCDPGHTGRIKP